MARRERGAVSPGVDTGGQAGRGSFSRKAPAAQEDRHPAGCSVVAPLRPAHPRGWPRGTGNHSGTASSSRHAWKAREGMPDRGCTPFSRPWHLMNFPGCGRPHRPEEPQAVGEGVGDKHPPVTAFDRPAGRPRHTVRSRDGRDGPLDGARRIRQVPAVAGRPCTEVCRASCACPGDRQPKRGRMPSAAGVTAERGRTRCSAPPPSGSARWP
jgi:hypothetical protein